MAHPIHPAPPQAQGLYDPRYEHDACGVGFVVNIKGVRSHAVVERGLQVLINLQHRGACGCEANTGDGAGILIQMPDRFLRKAANALGIGLPPAGQYGVGNVFLPRNDGERKQLRALIEQIIGEEGQTFLGWRPVPTTQHVLGAAAAATMPVIEQLFVGYGGDAPGKASLKVDPLRFERKLYVIRKRIEHAADQLALTERHMFYIPSLSSKTLIYKGMLTADQIQPTFPDLTDPDVESALALVHQRFSTNTFPSWPLAHPYRYVAHNGEINTLRGNINWMRAREGLLQSDVFGDDLKKILPIIREGGSDTATFDNVLEFLVMAGRSLPHAILMMIPEPWSAHETMNPELKAFYEYHSSLMEPWDGPASIAFTDGTLIGAVLDRNGLRPSRYYVTKDDLVVMASEVGVLDIPAEDILVKERLHPGRIFLVDTAQGPHRRPTRRSRRELASAQPYARWLAEHLVDIEDLPAAPYLPAPSHETVPQRQQTFGYTQEDLRLLLAPMATNGEEPIGSMGTDTALAVLSDRPRLLYDYFRQLLRAGHQSAARRDPRGAGDVDGIDGRAGGQSARSAARVVPPDQDQVPDHRQRRSWRSCATSTSRAFKSITLPMLFDPRQGGAGPRARDGPAEAAGQRRRATRATRS